MNVGLQGGALQVNDDYSEIKAGTTITISSNLGAAAGSLPAKVQLGLAGQIQAVQTIWINSSGSITLGGATLVAKGNIIMQSAGTTNLSGGIINSQQGMITISAGSNPNINGILSLGGTAPILLSSSGTIMLNGESVAIGSSTAFARVLRGGDLDIGADLYAPGMGSVTIENASTQLQADGNFEIGAPSNAVGTPDGVTISGGTLSASGSFSIYSLGSITTTSSSAISANGLLFSADDDITINSGSILTAGQALSLLADASTGLQGTLTLSSDVTISDPGYTVTLSGYSVSNSASITDGKLVTETGK